MKKQRQHNLHTLPRACHSLSFLGETKPASLCPFYAKPHRFKHAAILTIYGSHPLICFVLLCMTRCIAFNMQEYWEAYDRHPHLQGGFIWDWVDQGLINTAKDPSGTPVSTHCAWTKKRISVSYSSHEYCQGPPKV